MKSTRERILQTLLSQPGATINDLAEAVNINTISVRHHLTNLQAEGLIQANEERHGVGRPRLIYSLTDTGREKFPTRYFSLTNRLLDQLKSSLPEKQINEMFINMAKSLAMEQGDKMKKMSLEKKLDYLQKVLGDEGFMIEWEKTGNEYRIIETACPFYHVGQAHPEVCLMDQTLISTLLSIPAEKVECVLHGDAHCVYVIKSQNREK